MFFVSLKYYLFKMNLNINFIIMKMDSQVIGLFNMMGKIQEGLNGNKPDLQDQKIMEMFEAFGVDAEKTDPQDSMENVQKHLDENGYEADFEYKELMELFASSDLNQLDSPLIQNKTKLIKSLLNIYKVDPNMENEEHKDLLDQLVKSTLSFVEAQTKQREAEYQANYEQVLKDMPNLLK